MGHKVCVLLRGFGAPYNVCFTTRIGGPVDLKSKGRRAPGGFGSGFLGSGGQGGDLD